MHKYLDNCLKMFNFGHSIWSRISLFFRNREACILLGDELTKKILLEQRLSQGDVVFPYVFMLAVEILLIKVNLTKNIEERIKVGNLRWWYQLIYTDEPRIPQKMCRNPETLRKNLRIAMQLGENVTYPYWR